MRFLHYALTKPCKNDVSAQYRPAIAAIGLKQSREWNRVVNWVRWLGAQGGLAQKITPTGGGGSGGRHFGRLTLGRRMNVSHIEAALWEEEEAAPNS